MSTVSLAELLLESPSFPEGRRKVAFGLALGEQAALLFGDRVLPFDAGAAKAYAVVVARARHAGRPIGVADGQIAATAAARDFSVATRDTTPFAATGVPIIDPWGRAQ